VPPRSSRAEFLHKGEPRAGADTMFGCIIGSISLSGSVVAFAKLQGLVSEKAINSPIQKGVNGLLFLSLLGLVGWLGFADGRCECVLRAARRVAARSACSW
jgi:NAD/NADP transhydrogenase beta subunit